MRTLASVTLCYALFFAAAAHAEPAGIAVFNVQKVVTECDALREAKISMEKKFGEQKTSLEKQRETLEKKIASIKGKATEKQQAELNKMNREYTEKAQAFVRVFQADEARLRTEIDAVVTAAAKELSLKRGYLAVFDSSATVYADTAIDVTAAMLAETNEQWKKAKATPADAKDAAKGEASPAGK
ncbi:MAG: OmpH family outer membrane protein [Desulfovibrio sp.]|jgi:outer membrane protein|nr:OmpH family outer membrane protein [Desulfovibrio sp.]